ncbi:MAG: cell division protein ZapA [Clostridiales bacterium]|nr:cell division protein ZapA [Clostridiales bacterium]
MERNRISVNLAGQEFRIASVSDPEYLRSLEEDLNRRVRKAKEKYRGESASRCVLLAMLEMEDELKRLSNEVNSVDRKIEELKRVRMGEKRTESGFEAPVKRPFERKKPVGV